MYQQKSNSNKTWLFLLGCPVLACGFICAVCVAFSVLSFIVGGSAEIDDSPRTIETADDTFTVPGNAFMDGRDLDAVEPITLGEINIWDSVPRGQVVCQLEHGTAIRLEDAEYSDGEQRWYLKVSANGCEGWVSEPFVSSWQHQPVGEIF